MLFTQQFTHFWKTNTHRNLRKLNAWSTISAEIRLPINFTLPTSFSTTRSCNVKSSHTSMKPIWVRNLIHKFHHNLLIFYLLFLRQNVHSLSSSKARSAFASWWLFSCSPSALFAVWSDAFVVKKLKSSLRNLNRAVSAHSKTLHEQSTFKLTNILPWVTFLGKENSIYLVDRQFTNLDSTIIQSAGASKDLQGIFSTNFPKKNYLIAQIPYETNYFPFITLEQSLVVKLKHSKWLRIDVAFYSRRIFNLSTSVSNFVS